MVFSAKLFTGLTPVRSAGPTGHAPVRSPGPTGQAGFTGCIGLLDFFPVSERIKGFGRRPRMALWPAQQYFDGFIRLKSITPDFLDGHAELGRQVHARGNDLQGQIRSILHTLHNPPQKSVLGAATGDNADFSHFFFFFIVCLNFKTAKFSSMDVSVSLVCKSSSKIPAINSPLLCMSAF